MQIKKAVIPVAGWSTKWLPLAKVISKELLPIGNKPVIHYIVTEALEAGIEEIIFVLSPHKQSIVDYFRPNMALEEFLKDKPIKLQEKLAEAHFNIKISSVIQPHPTGLASAILATKSLIAGEPFAVLLPDEVFLTQNVTSMLMKYYQQEKCSCLIGMEVLPSEFAKYGMLDLANELHDVAEVITAIEKPTSNSPSNFAAMGRYVFDNSIFASLEQVSPGFGGELQLTDAFEHLAQSVGLKCLKYDGEHHDIGDFAGWLTLNNRLGGK